MSLTNKQFHSLLDIDLRSTTFKTAPRPWAVILTTQLIAEAADGHVVYSGEGVRIVDANGKGICSLHNQTATTVAYAQAIVTCVNEEEVLRTNYELARTDRDLWRKEAERKS